MGPEQQEIGAFECLFGSTIKLGRLILFNNILALLMPFVYIFFLTRLKVKEQFQ
jgi:hypothetical protein